MEDRAACGAVPAGTCACRPGRACTTRNMAAHVRPCQSAHAPTGTTSQPHRDHQAVAVDPQEQPVGAVRDRSCRTQACECAMGICTPVLCESRLRAGLGRFTSECHRAYDFAATLCESTGRLCVRPIGTIRALCAFVSLCISRPCDAARSNLPLHALRALLGRFVFCVTFACRRLASLTAFGFFLARGELANIYLCRYFTIWSFGRTRLAEEVGGLGVEYDSTAVGRDRRLLTFPVGRCPFGAAGAIELCRLSCALLAQEEVVSACEFTREQDVVFVGACAEGAVRIARDAIRILAYQRRARRFRAEIPQVDLRSADLDLLARRS